MFHFFFMLFKPNNCTQGVHWNMFVKLRLVHLFSRFRFRLFYDKKVWQLCKKKKVWTYRRAFKIFEAKNKVFELSGRTYNCTVHRLVPGLPERTQSTTDCNASFLRHLSSIRISTPETHLYNKQHDYLWLIYPNVFNYCFLIFQEWCPNSSVYSRLEGSRGRVHPCVGLLYRSAVIAACRGNLLKH